MPILNTQEKLPDLKLPISKLGWISIGSGLLAILVLVVAYKTSSSADSSVLNIFFLFLPGTALGLSLAGVFFGKEAIKEKNNRVLGVVGILISLFPLLFCCLLPVLVLILSGVMGLNFGTALTKIV